MVNSEELKSLLVLSESQLLTQLGAKLEGVSTVAQALKMTEADIALLSTSLSAGADISNGIGFARQDLLDLWQRIQAGITKLRMRGEKFLSENQARLRKLICDDFKYCEKVRVYGNELELLVALVGFLEAALGGLPIGEIVIVLAKQGLSQFCMC